jgi:tellurite resistance protein
MKKSPWLDRFPVGLFAIPVGLLALAGAWRRAATFGWTLPALAIADAIAWSGAVLLGVLMLLYLLKSLRYPHVFKSEFAHPLTGSLMALVSVALLLCAVYFGELRHAGWLALVLAALAWQGVIAVRIVAMLTTASLPLAAVTPALYIPPVAGGLVGGMALNTLGYPGWAGLLFGMGIASWALLEVRVLNRLFEGVMPEPLRPTIGVEMAPPSVATLAVATIWPTLPADVLIIGLGICAGPIVAVIARYKWWSAVPFGIGFWSFSFPMAAMASAVIEVVRRGSWPANVGGIALGVASLIIVFLSVKTLVLLVHGKLLPPFQNVKSP